MNAAIKERWLAALKSDEYRFGRCYLKSERCIDGSYEPACHCALGVLIDLYAKDHPEEEVWFPRPSGVWSVFGTPHRGQTVLLDASLPQRIMEWAELSEEHADRVPDLNDRAASYRPVIAFIEKLL